MTGQQKSQVLVLGLAVGSVFVGYALEFLGVRGIAKAFGVKSLLLSLPVIVGVSLAAGILIGNLPHATPPGPVLQFKIPFIMGAAFSVLHFISMLLVWKVHKKAGGIYSNAFWWFFLAYVVQVGMDVVVLANGLLYANIFQEGTTTAMRALVPSALGFLAAAYAFSRINSLTVRRQAGREVNSIDIITFVASLGSNFQAIDPILDEVRVVTATITPGEKLDARQEGTLQRVYLQLERYLTTADAVRTFTKEELRTMVARNFTVDELAMTFWPKLS